MDTEKIHEIAAWCDKIAYENGLGAMLVINRLMQLKLKLGTIEQAKRELEKELQMKKDNGGVTNEKEISKEKWY